MAEIQIREITGSSLVMLTFRLRFEVWNEEAEPADDAQALGFITDMHDEHARHWAAFDGGEMVAAGRMCIHKSLEDTLDAYLFSRMPLPVPIATLNRLVVRRK